MIKKQVEVQENSFDQTYLQDVSTSINLFAVHKNHVKANWSFPIHQHTQMFEVCYVIQGKVALQLNRHTHIVGTGDVVLIPPMLEHAKHAISKSDCVFFCMHFQVDDQHFNQLLATHSEIYYSSDSLLVRRIHSLLNEFTALTEQAGKTMNNMRVLSVVYTIFSEIEDVLSENKTNVGHPETEEELAHHIATELKRIVKEPVCNENSTIKRQWINKIAQQCGISTKHCNRIFHRIYGMSPRTYLTQLRLEEAKKMLVQYDLPIDQIGLSLGYQEVSSFSRQFKRWTGMTPSRYRALQ